MTNKVKQFSLPLLLVIASGILLTGCSIGGSKNTDQVGKPTITQPTPQPTKSVQESIIVRPYISLLPGSDGHRLTLKMVKIPLVIKSFEYELIYFADFEGNKIERGVDSGGRPVDLLGKTDYTKEFLLGSESCSTGKCKYRYDEGVTEGTLTLKFISDKGIDKFITSFRLQNTISAKEGLSTGDGGFLFNPTGKINGIALTIQTAGLPKGIEFNPKSSPYAIFPSTVVNKGSVSFTSTISGGPIYGYNGTTWNKLETTSANGQLTAESSGNFLFILGE